MKHVAISLAFTLLITICHSADPQARSAEYPPEIEQAISAFKSGPRHENDYAIPRKLLPLLKAGLSQDDVIKILGEATKCKKTADGEYWTYGLFFSQFIDIQFDADGSVTKVTSTLKTN